MLDLLLILLINTFAYYVAVGCIVSLTIMIFQLMFPYTLELSLTDYLLMMIFWASVVFHLITKDQSQNQ